MIYVMKNSSNLIYLYKKKEKECDNNHVVVGRRNDCEKNSSFHFSFLAYFIKKKNVIIQFDEVGINLRTLYHQYVIVVVAKFKFKISMVRKYTINTTSKMIFSDN